MREVKKKAERNRERARDCSVSGESCSVNQLAVWRGRCRSPSAETHEQRFRAQVLVFGVNRQKERNRAC